MKQKIFAVVAAGTNRVIGNNGWLPWPEMKCDYERLIALAYDKPAIMGRLSYESPNQFLSSNHNLILTSKKIEKLPINCATVASKEEALNYYKHEPEICILGGQKVFELFLPELTHVYLTQIHINTKGDAYFPELSDKEWKLVQKQSFKSSLENPLDYDFVEYKRKSLP